MESKPRASRKTVQDAEIFQVLEQSTDSDVTIFSSQEDARFTIIIPDREYLMDVAKQYYARLRAGKIKECKLISPYHRVCKQSHPIQLAHVHKECEVDMLQSIRTIPSSC
jgi:hypothetical protein